MIRVTCSNCSATMNVDDGFAGGACRCKQCGTIQAVPALQKSGQNAGTAVKGKSIRLTPARQHLGSGLDELGEVVSSSGLTSSGLNRQAGGRGDAKRGGRQIESMGLPTIKKRRFSPVMIAIAAIVVAGVGVAAFMMMTADDEPAAAQTTAANGAQGQSAAVPGRSNASASASSSTANPLGAIDLSSATNVAYVIDRGQATAAHLPAVERLVLGSLSALGQDHVFQVLYWGDDAAIENAGKTVIKLPSSPVAATPTQIDLVAERMAEILPLRSSEPLPAIRAAIDGGATAIVLVTAKGWQLPDSFVGNVAALRGTSKTVIHVIAAGENEPGPLSNVAAATGGTLVRLADLTRK